MESSPGQSQSLRRRQNSLWQLYCGLGALGWLGWYVLTLRLPQYDGSGALYLQIFSVVIGISLLGALLLLGTHPRWSSAARIAMFALGLLAALAAWRLQLKEPLYMGVVALALIAIALPVGYWIGSQMERLSHLIPLCVALSLADIYSVWQGPSHHIARQVAQYQSQVADAAAHGGAQAAAAVPAPLAGYFIVQLPLAGSRIGVPVLGIGDFVVLAFLLRAAWLSGVSPLRLLLVALLSTFAALAASELSGMALPALPFIALGTVGWLWFSEPRVRLLGRQELLLTLLVTGLFGGLILAKALR